MTIERQWHGAGASAVVHRLAMVVTLMICVVTALWSAAGPTRAAGPARSLVVVGIPGLAAGQLSPGRTPALWALAGHSGLASVSVRAVRSSTCPVDGWLTLGAGSRAGAPPGPMPGCPPPDQSAQLTEVGHGARVAGLAGLQAWNNTLSFGARLGLLGDAVRQVGGCVGAVGPGAALAATTSDGLVQAYTPTLDGLSSVLGRCPVTLVSPPTPSPESTPAETAPAATARDGTPPSIDEVAAYDRDVQRIVSNVPAGSRVIVIGLSNLTSRPHLQLVLDTGAAAGARTSLLQDPSTRRTGLVQLTDATTTVLDAVDVPVPADAVGSIWRRGSAVSRGDALALLADADLAAQRQRDLVAPFFLLLVLSQFGLYLLVTAAVRWGAGRSRRPVLSMTRWAALAFAAAPASTFLANLYPWWRASHPLLSVIATVAVADAVIVGLAAAGPWRRSPFGPVGVVAGLSALALGLDVVTGSRLQESSLAGYTPLVAGRFYGFGNVAFALFATSALIAAGCLAHYLQRHAPTVVAIGVPVGLALVATAVDGSAAWGADVGGVLSLVPGTLAFAVLLTGRRLTLRWLALGALAAVATTTVLGIIDYRRPPEDRTHLGLFVEQVLNGEAGSVVLRKAHANLDILTSSVLTVLVPVAVAFLVLVLLRPSRSRAPALAQALRLSPAFRASLIAVVVTTIVGFATNDSGIVIPALAMTVAIPLAVAASVATLAMADRTPPSPALEGAGDPGDTPMGRWHPGGAGQSR